MINPEDEGRDDWGGYAAGTRSGLTDDQEDIHSSAAVEVFEERVPAASDSEMTIGELQEELHRLGARIVSLREFACNEGWEVTFRKSLAVGREHDVSCVAGSLQDALLETLTEATNQGWHG